MPHLRETRTFTVSPAVQTVTQGEITLDDIEFDATIEIHDYPGERYTADGHGYPPEREVSIELSEGQQESLRQAILDALEGTALVEDIDDVASQCIGLAEEAAYEDTEW